MFSLSDPRRNISQRYAHPRRHGQPNLVLLTAQASSHILEGRRDLLFGVTGGVDAQSWAYMSCNNVTGPARFNVSRQGNDCYTDDLGTGSKV